MGCEWRLKKTFSNATSTHPHSQKHSTKHPFHLSKTAYATGSEIQRQAEKITKQFCEVHKHLTSILWSPRSPSNISHHPLHCYAAALCFYAVGRIGGKILKNPQKDHFDKVKLASVCRIQWEEALLFVTPSVQNVCPWQKKLPQPPPMQSALKTLKP